MSLPPSSPGILFPVVIGQLRYGYGGGGSWVAMDLQECEDPAGLLATYREASLEGEALDEYRWLDEALRQTNVAVGMTPDEALAALYAKRPGLRPPN